LKILFISLFLPQEKAYHAGGRYVFEMIKNLSQRHEIHLVTRLEENEVPLLENLRPFCKTIHPYTYKSQGRRGLVHLPALALNYLGFSRFADRLARSGEFNLIQVEWVETAVLIKKRKTPMALTAHDVITKPAERRMKSARGLKKLFPALIFVLFKALEISIIKRFDVVFTLSEYDRKYLRALGAGTKVRVVSYPAGLDVTERHYARETNSILFLASYKYLIRNVIPEARFVIAGYGPPPELTALQERDPSVTVPGFVDDLDACYKQASVFVAPILIGGGVIVKVLDALAAGTPVVTTTYGNEGIGAIPEKDLLIADSPPDIADAVIRVLRDRKLADYLSRNGQDFVRTQYTLDAAIKTIEETYRHMVKRES
jgi:polysaccharide biosynthesis protein PslH